MNLAMLVLLGADAIYQAQQQHIITITIDSIKTFTTPTRLQWLITSKLSLLCSVHNNQDIIMCYTTIRCNHVLYYNQVNKVLRG